MELGSKHRLGRLSACTAVLSTLRHPTVASWSSSQQMSANSHCPASQYPCLYREALKTEGTEGIEIPPQTDTNLFSSPLGVRVEPLWVFLIVRSWSLYFSTWFAKRLCSLVSYRLLTLYSNVCATNLPSEECGERDEVDLTSIHLSGSTWSSNLG